MFTSNYDPLEKKKPFYNRMTSSAWQRPTLTGGSPLLPSALKNLTSVFGMGTGVTSSPSSPDVFTTQELLYHTQVVNASVNFNFFLKDFKINHSKLDKTNIDVSRQPCSSLTYIWESPRSISICQLHMSPCFHTRPIHLIIFEGSYLLA